MQEGNGGLLSYQEVLFLHEHWVFYASVCLTFLIIQGGRHQRVTERTPPNTSHASFTFMCFKAVIFTFNTTQRSISAPRPEFYGGFLQKGILVHSLHTDALVAADLTNLNPTLTSQIYLILLNRIRFHYHQ